MIINLIQEIFIAVITAAILIYLVRTANREHLWRQKGWSSIIAGFSLICLGGIIAISGHLPVLGGVFIIDGEPAADAGETIGYFTGSLLLCAGILRWLPIVLRAQKAEQDLARRNADLQECQQDLEQKVEERTNELYSTYEQLYASQAELQMRFDEITKLNAQLQETRDSLIHAEKMAGIGTLAAGVAHEINNPLAAIIGYAEGGIRDINLKRGNDEYRIKSLERIRDAGWRCARIVNALKSYARTETFDIRPHDFNEVVEAALSLVIPQAKKEGIRISVELGQGLPAVECDDGKIQTIIINLVKNAIDAVAAGGDVSVKSDFRDDMAVVEVSDTGMGIPEEIQEKVFDPFFTTKELGKGAGLGLSVCAGLVEMHGGKIALESEEGKGTRVTVSIPPKHAPAREEVSEAGHGAGRYGDSTGPEGYKGA